MLIHNKDDIEFVTEFPCFLGHPVSNHRYHLEIINRILKLYSTNLLYLTLSSISIKQNVCNFTMRGRGSKDNRSKFEPGFPKVYEHL